MPKRTFVYGAMILLAANLFNRILGFLYQYLIMTYLGGEVYGLFNMVFPLYMMALVLTTAGIPLAVSKLVSEEISLGRPRQAEAIFRIAVTLLASLGAFVSIVLYFFSPFFTERLFPDIRVLKIFQICAPAIFIVSFASAFRGYFQGLQNMLPTALSQIAEQIVRITVGFSAALYFFPRGTEWAAAGLAIGMLAGEAVGLLSIGSQFFLIRKSFSFPAIRSESVSLRPLLLKLWRLATPVTAGRLLASGLSALDALIIPQRLRAAGYTVQEAATLYGQLGGTGFTLLSFPSVFTFSLATSLLPSISEAAAHKQMNQVRVRSTEALRLTVLLGLPCLIIIFYFSYPLAAFFKSANIAPVLRILALGGLFTYLQQTTNGILQGLGKMHLPVIHSLIAACIRLPLLVYLTGRPAYGLTGCALAYVAGFISVASLNLLALSRLTGLPLNFRDFVLQPGVAGLVMLLIFKLLTPLLPDQPFVFPVTMAAGLAGYILTLAGNGGLSRKDLCRIPWLGKFISR
ncbi:MAG: polysaccharide biosynthesis protein [Peptococcaceae bacterium]|jgi:stage V sporulation protein B|nr:polysaccharide biosynthesis protein [Peptococcaceae bacterium]